MSAPVAAKHRTPTSVPIVREGLPGWHPPRYPLFLVGSVRATCRCHYRARIVPGAGGPR